MANSDLLNEGFLRDTADFLGGLDKHVADYLLSYVVTEHIELFESLQVCESPIEQLLCIALLDAIDNLYHRYDREKIWFILRPQFEIEVDSKAFRLDFSLLVVENPLTESAKKTPIAIECDGHAFHEKTKGQAKRDKARDRLIQLTGHHILHYTGSEIWEDPDKCAHEILKFAAKVSGLPDPYRKRG